MFLSGKRIRGPKEDTSSLSPNPGRRNSYKERSMMKCANVCFILTTVYFGRSVQFHWPFWEVRCKNIQIRKGLKVAKAHQNRPRLSAECLGNPQRKSLFLFRYCPTKHLWTCKSHYALCTSHYSPCFVGIETLHWASPCQRVLLKNSEVRNPVIAVILIVLFSPNTKLS